MWKENRRFYKIPEAAKEPSRQIALGSKKYALFHSLLQLWEYGMYYVCRLSMNANS